MKIFGVVSEAEQERRLLSVQFMRRNRSVGFLSAQSMRWSRSAGFLSAQLMRWKGNPGFRGRGDTYGDED